MSKFGIFPTEALLAVMALGGAWIIWRLLSEPRRLRPYRRRGARYSQHGAAQPQSLSSEELARRRAVKVRVSEVSSSYD